MPIHPRLSRAAMRAVLCGLFVLAGCGGGGGDGGEVIDTPAATTVSGAVVYDAPVAGASVTVKDAEGHTWSATTDAQGRYLVRLGAAERLVPPVLVQAVGTGVAWTPTGTPETVASTGRLALSPAMVPAGVDKRDGGRPAPFRLYAVSEQAGVVHVTPVTDLVVGALTGRRSEAVFARLGDPVVGDVFALATVRAVAGSVRGLLSQLGLPATLLDAPAGPEGVVPVDLVRTHEVLASGDVLGAMQQLLSAAAANAAAYGCAGEAVGRMRDDGLARPSCLPGPNLEVSFQTEAFVPLESVRSLDIAARADELSGAASATGGWKYQGPRVGTAERLTALATKVVAAVRGRDAAVRSATTEGEALAAVRQWTDDDWQAFGAGFCGEVTAAQLSDLTYAYLVLKHDMATHPPGDIPDAAAGLSVGSFGSRNTRVVNRIVPTSFEDGSRVSACPLLRRVWPDLKAIVAQYVPGRARLPLATMVADVHQRVDKYLAEANQVAAPDLNQQIVDMELAKGTVEIEYGLPFLNGGEMVGIVENCRPPDGYYRGTAYCADPTAAGRAYLVRLDAAAATVPPDVAAGSTAPSAGTFLQAFSTAAAQLLMAQYEQGFSQDFGTELSALYDAFEVQGVVLDAWRQNVAREASVLVADVSGVQFRVDSFGVKPVGELVMRRTDLAIPAIDLPEGPAPRRRLGTVMRVHPTMLPALVACRADDEACLGRLRRTRTYTPSPVAIDTSSDTSSLLFSHRPWELHAAAAYTQHEEAMLFQPPRVVPFVSEKQ